MDNAVLYGIMLTLLNKKKVTKKYLSEKYEMSERNVIRYIDAIAAGGVPVFSIRGKYGGYCISSEFKLDSTYFTDEELKRIISAVKNDARHDGTSTSIVDKINYLSTRRKEEQYFLQSSSLIIDAGTWNNPGAYRSKMETLQKAIESKSSLQLSYVDRYESRSARLFDPYYRILKGGVWYTYGWCHYRNDFRLFKLARIKSLNETSKHFERRPHDVYSKLDGMNIEEIETVDIEFEFSSTILNEIEEWLGFDAIMERGLKYVAKATILGGNQLIAKLLSFGSSIKILSPASVREEVLVECKRVLRNSE